MTVLARRIVATPARSASEAWAVIVDLLAPAANSPARKELQAIVGIATSLISDEAFRNAPAVVYGSGPRVRIYCLYGEDAVTSDSAGETKLTVVATEGDWKMSLPCPEVDLTWVQDALKNRSSHVTARDMNSALADDAAGEDTSKAVVVDREAFFRP